MGALIFPERRGHRIGHFLSAERLQASADMCLMTKDPIHFKEADAANCSEQPDHIPFLLVFAWSLQINPKTYWREKRGFSCLGLSEIKRMFYKLDPGLVFTSKHEKQHFIPLNHSNTTHMHITSFSRELSPWWFAKVVLSCIPAHFAKLQKARWDLTDLLHLQVTEPTDFSILVHCANFTT